MVEPISLSIAIGYLIKSAPYWFHSLQETLLSKGKDLAITQGKQRLTSVLDEKKHLRHMELALQNAAERGLKQFHTSEDRDNYRSILEILSASTSGTIRDEAMHLFTLSDNPDLTSLTEKYNLSQRIHALAQNKTYEEINAKPYLNSFFEALIAELYNDPLFREQMSDVIHVRAALKGQRSLEDIITLLSQVKEILTDSYTPEQFKQDIDTYIEYIEGRFRYHKFAGIVFSGDEDTAPELDGIFVPLSIIPQSQSFLEEETSEEKTKISAISLLKQSTYLVLLGGPGSGKSTITRYITWSHARANLTKSWSPSSKYMALLPGKPVPLRIELRLLSAARKQRPDYSFLSYATEVMLGREDIIIHSQMFKTLLERRSMLLLFDGLDEVPTLEERQQLCEEIETFAQRYPGNHILVTSRPIGYNIAHLANRWFQHGLVQEFDNEQIHLFLEGWYKHVLKYSSLPTDVYDELESFYRVLENNLRLRKLATNPLLLTVIAALHRYERLPDRRVQVYEKCADLLLDTWAKLKSENNRWKDMKMGKEDQIACIAHLGFFLHERAQEHEETRNRRKGKDQYSDDTATDIPASLIRREIEWFLKSQKLFSRAEQGAEAGRFLDLVKTEAGLLVERGTDETGEALYGFVHRTFQEYFAAVDIYEQYHQEGDPAIITDFLQEHVYDPHWHEVVLLLFGKLRHKLATNQLRHILNDKHHQSRYTELMMQELLFVCNCLAEDITIENDFAEQIISKMTGIIKDSPFPSQRKKILEAFAILLETRQYADLSQKKLEALIKDENALEISIKLDVAQTLYLNSGKKEKRHLQAIQTLVTLAHLPNVSFEQILQIVQILLENSPTQSEERQQGIQLLLSLTQRSDLSLEQLIQIAVIIYLQSPIGSKEQQKGAQLLLTYAQLADLTVEQREKIAEIIYLYSSPGSEEERQNTQLLLTHAQRSDLTPEQLIQAVRNLYIYSPAKSEERQKGEQLLSSLTQRSDLTPEQVIQVAEIIYDSTIPGTEIPRQSGRLLLALAQYSDLSPERLIQIVELIHLWLPYQEERSQSAQLLIALAQWPDLTPKQVIQVAEALHQYYDRMEVSQPPYQSLLAHVERSDFPPEQLIQLADILTEMISRAGEQWSSPLLLELSQRSDLSPEQSIQLAQVVMSSPYESDLRRNVGQMLLELSQRSDLTPEQSIQLAGVVTQYAFDIREISPQVKQSVRQRLLTLAQRSDLTLEQLIQSAKFLDLREVGQLIEENPLLPALAQRSDLSVEQQIQVAEMLLSRGLTESEQQHSTHLLLALAQRSDLSPEQMTRVAELINIRSSINSVDIHFIFELAKQTEVPTQLRDRMYQQLQIMVPQYESQMKKNREYDRSGEIYREDAPKSRRQW